MAERVGFEPTLPVKVNTLSKRAPSATRPSLQRFIRIASACDDLDDRGRVWPRGGRVDLLPRVYSYESCQARLQNHVSRHSPVLRFPAQEDRCRARWQAQPGGP